MDFYNLAITCGINILVILLIEGILYFGALSIIFNKIFDGIVSSAAPEINTLMNNNYEKIVANFDTLPENLIDQTFVSKVSRLFLIGTFADQITEEDAYIRSNDITSYIAFTILIVCPLIFLLLVKLINYLIYDDKYSINWKTIVYSILLSLLVLMIFILPVIFKVFVNLQDNIDTNELQLTVVKILLKYFSK